jgi:hypothetical protein
MHYKAIYAIILIVAVVAIIFAVLSLSQKGLPHSSMNESVPILLYAKGIPYLLYNLSFSSQHIVIESQGAPVNFSYGYFKPISLINSAMYAGSLRRNSTSAVISYMLSNPSFYLNSINNSFGNGSLVMELPVSNFSKASALVLGLRFFPLEYYSSYPTIALKSALYPLLYYSNESDVRHYIENKSVPGILQYNITEKAPVSFAIFNGSNGYTLNVTVSNLWNNPLDIKDIVLAGYFLGSESANVSLPKVSVVNRGDAYAIAGISSLGINISTNSTLSFLQSNISAIDSLLSRIHSGSITSANQLYSYFNSTLNVSRLEYIESIMMENSSYYIAMHQLKNYDPLNASVEEYAYRLSSWNNAYKGLLTLNVSRKGLLSLPTSENAVNGTGYIISPGQNASFSFKLGNLSYEGQSTSPINGMNYTVFAYFNGVEYSDSAANYN